MTKKDNLQREILEKVKPGTKPSHLKKLKRSKSADDIPKAPPLPLTEPEVEQLKQENNQLKAELQSVQERLKESGLNSLALIPTNSNPSELTELDQNLIARHKNLKDWFTQYQKAQSLEKELAENIEQASEELIGQDKVISQLRQQVSKLKQEKQSLTRDLELTSRLAQSRKVPYYSPSDYPDPYQQLKYALYSLITVMFSLWLVNNYLAQDKKNYA